MKKIALLILFMGVVACHAEKSQPDSAKVESDTVIMSSEINPIITDVSNDRIVKNKSADQKKLTSVTFARGVIYFTVVKQGDNFFRRRA